MRRLFHPFRLLARAVTLAWLWRNRHDIVRWARFVGRTAANRSELDRDQILAEARARLALTMDPRTRVAPDLDIERVGDGNVVVRTHLERPTAQVARDVLEQVSGVEAVDVVDLNSPLSAGPANPPGTPGGARAAVPSTTATGTGNGG
jgi:hypothetical protein